MNGNELKQKRLNFWDEDNLSFSLFPYKPTRGGEADEVSQFILGFKHLDTPNLSEAVYQICDALQRYVAIWKLDFNLQYVLPTPGHRAGHIPESSQLLCRILATQFEFIYRDDILYRKESIRPSHMTHPRQRPTASEHFDSLGCLSGANLNGAGVLLFDDVRTTGNTSQACRWRLQEDTKCGDVVRVFLGCTGT